ncbi:MAG: DHH family phosphoesterase [Alphaproteobacteria bacterium]|nr:DHH family phosphoesterase [Alphaproteobacteria bacterium]
MITQKQLDIFDEKIRAANSIFLFAHKNPDGDAICSVLAMARLIELNYDKEVTCVYDGNIPDNLDDVPLRKRFRFFEKIEEDARVDVAIVMDMDCRVTHNIGGAARFMERARDVIEIDHHQNEDKDCCALCIDDDTAAATAEIVYELMKRAGWQADFVVWRLLMTAIITDTGCFKYVKNGNVLRIAADLVDAGVDIQRTISGLNNKPRKTIVTEAASVGKTEFYFKNRLALAIIDNHQYKNIDGRGETVLNLLGQMHGVEYIVLLKEQKPDQIGVSLRGRGRPVNTVAVALGGGGHEFAAGAVMHDSLENVKKKVLDLLAKEVRKKC